MPRQLLALIALLTGLAAVNAPAHAADAEAVACEIGVSVDVSSGSSATDIAQPLAKTARRSVCNAAPVEVLAAQAELVQPTVQIGIDRAYE